MNKRDQESETRSSLAPRLDDLRFQSFFKDRRSASELVSSAATPALLSANLDGLEGRAQLVVERAEGVSFEAWIFRNFPPSFVGVESALPRPLSLGLSTLRMHSRRLALTLEEGLLR